MLARTLGMSPLLTRRIEFYTSVRPLIPHTLPNYPLTASPHHYPQSPSPMAAAFTFGAFRDIVSVVELVVRALKSLSASSGSSYECQCLVQELLALKRILQILAAATLANIEIVAVGGVIAKVEFCHALVERVWEQVRKSNRALGAESGRTARRGVVACIASGVRAIEWELFKKKDVEAARKKLSRHVCRLNMFISTCSLCASPGLVLWHAPLSSSTSCSRSFFSAFAYL